MVSMSDPKLKVSLMPKIKLMIQKKVLNKNKVIQNPNPKRARHDTKNSKFNKQSINIAYWKQDRADLIMPGWPA